MKIGRLIEYTSWEGLWEPVFKYFFVFMGMFGLALFTWAFLVDIIMRFEGVYK